MSTPYLWWEHHFRLTSFSFTPTFSGTQPGSETTAWCRSVSTVLRWCFIVIIFMTGWITSEKNSPKRLYTHTKIKYPPSCCFFFPSWETQILNVKGFGFACVSSDLPSKYRRGQNHGSCPIWHFAVEETARGWNELWLCPNTSSDIQHWGQVMSNIWHRVWGLLYPTSNHRGGLSSNPRMSVWGLWWEKNVPDTEFSPSAWRFLVSIIPPVLYSHNSIIYRHLNPLLEPLLQLINTTRLKRCWPLDFQGTWGDTAGWIPYHITVIHGIVAYFV